MGFELPARQRTETGGNLTLTLFWSFWHFNAINLVGYLEQNSEKEKVLYSFETDPVQSFSCHPFSPPCQGQNGEFLLTTEPPAAV